MRREQCPKILPLPPPPPPPYTHTIYLYMEVGHFPFSSVGSNVGNYSMFRNLSTVIRFPYLRKCPCSEGEVWNFTIPTIGYLDSVSREVFDVPDLGNLMLGKRFPIQETYTYISAGLAVTVFNHQWQVTAYITSSYKY